MNTGPPLIAAPFQRPVRGLCTTRYGGASAPPFDSFNLGAACGDDPARVAENRRLLRETLPDDPCWLKQVHGNRVIHLDDWHDGAVADAAWTDRPGQVAAVLTADCLPLLVADRAGTCVAAIHAGWRGLAAGVIGECIGTLPARPEALAAWIGPRICREHYEVGEDVRRAFPGAEHAFTANREGHWLADLAAIAGKQLRDAGVGAFRDSRVCTAEGSRYFSYRRDHLTGRMATAVWIERPGDGRHPGKAHRSC